MEKSGFHINQKPDFNYKLNFVNSYLDYCYMFLWEITSRTFGSEFVNKHHCICSRMDSCRSCETVTSHVYPYWIINCLLYNEMSLRQIASSWKVEVSWHYVPVNKKDKSLIWKPLFSTKYLKLCSKSSFHSWRQKHWKTCVFSQLTFPEKITLTVLVCVCVCGRKTIHLLLVQAFD